MIARRLLAVLAMVVCCGVNPAQAAPPLSIYGQLPGFERAAISPSGDHIAVIGVLEGERQLVVMDASRKVLLTSKIGKVKVRGIQWAGDQYVLVTFSQTVGLGADFTTDKAELHSVLVVPLDGSKAWAVFDKEQSITGGVSGTYGVVQRDGKWYGYFGGVTMIYSRFVGFVLPEGVLRPDLYEVDLQTKKLRHIAKRADDNNSVSRYWLVDGQGAVAASLDMLTSGSWSIYNGKHDKLASGTDPLGNVDLIGLTPDNANVVYSKQDPDTRQTTWYSVPLGGGTPVPYLDKEAVQDIIADRARHLIGYTADAAGNEAHFFDARQEKIYKASQRAFPGVHMTLVDQNDTFDRLLVKTEGPGDPITWWVVNIRTGQADMLGTSYPIAETDVGPMRMVPYKAGDGMAMEGVLTLPPLALQPGGAARNLPAVVLPHGGPFGYYDTAGFDWMAQAFASRGYAVFQPNYRGSGGYGEAFVQAGHGQYGRKMQSDVSDGLAELVRQGIVDPKRVCIMGASYGGYAALAGVTLQQGIYRCAVSYAGMSDLGRMMATDMTATGDNAMVGRELKDEVGDWRTAKDVSPIRFVDRISVPVLLIHGKDDTVVAFGQSSAMADAMKDKGKDVEFVTLPGEDHWLSSGETRLAMLQAAVDFVLKHNPPDPVK